MNDAVLLNRSIVFTTLAYHAKTGYKSVRMDSWVGTPEYMVINSTHDITVSGRDNLS
ncbi:hypothetical protein J6590_075831 [Homalodisca vitripennis]|nr:hypothetical protein J6590_075831 [Homalodisca vitripennis]